MSRQLLEQSAAPLRTSGLALQRKCDCGNHTVAGAECDQCGKKRTSRRSNAPAVRPLPSSRPRIQRQAADDSATAELFSAAAPASEAAPAGEAAQTPVPAEPAAETAMATEAPGSARLVEDDATELQAGQMRKSEFLAKLHTEVCATADSALAGTERSTDGCPYLDFWFRYYEGQSSAHIERAIHRYAPEAAMATTASAYIPLVAQRVRQGVERWARTGEISGVPEGVPLGLPGGLGGLFSGVGSLFFKAREGGARPAGDDPAAVQAELGAGKPLQSSVRSRMEKAFGQSFGDVRAHTDATARRLSDEQNARAFTVGNHVAFGAGEYRPGTLMGDALIAHEFAHVVQQGGGSSTAVAPMGMGSSGYQALEENADEVAVSAIASLSGGGNGALANVAQQAIPRLRSGLQLQRCNKQTCSAGRKTVTVDFVRLHGASPSPATHLREANDVFSKCCVEFTQGANPSPESEAVTKSWLGGDTDLGLSGITCAATPAEEKDMYDKATLKHHLSSRMRVFYVKTFSGYNSAGFSRPPYCAAGYENHVVLQNTVANTTNPLAHEFGHILLNSGNHETDANLMAPSGGTELTDDQCTTIYNNA